MKLSLFSRARGTIGDARDRACIDPLQAYLLCYLSHFQSWQIWNCEVGGSGGFSGHHRNRECEACC